MIEGGSEERVDVWCGEICQRIAFQIAPEHLDRVELGCIGREVISAHSLGAGKMSIHELGAVGVGAIPDHEQRLLDLPAEVTEEGSNFDGRDIGIGIEGKIKSYALPAGRHGQSRDDGYLPMGSPGSPKDWGVPAQCPGAPDYGCHHEAALVDKDDVRFQSAGFFLSCGQSSTTQRRIALSLRSRARASGFCGLKPRPRSRRPR